MASNKKKRKKEKSGNSSELKVFRGRHFLERGSKEGVEAVGRDGGVGKRGRRGKRRKKKKERAEEGETRRRGERERRRGVRSGGWQGIARREEGSGCYKENFFKKFIRKLLGTREGAVEKGAGSRRVGWGGNGGKIFSFISIFQNGRLLSFLFSFSALRILSACRNC